MTVDSYATPPLIFSLSCHLYFTARTNSSRTESNMKPFTRLWLLSPRIILAVVPVPVSSPLCSLYIYTHAHARARARAPLWNAIRAYFTRLCRIMVFLWPFETIVHPSYSCFSLFSFQRSNIDSLPSVQTSSHPSRQQIVASPKSTGGWHAYRSEYEAIAASDSRALYRTIVALFHRGGSLDSHNEKFRDSAVHRIAAATWKREGCVSIFERCCTNSGWFVGQHSGTVDYASARLYVIRAPCRWKFW